MPVNSFQSNQGTQTPLLTDNTGGTGGTLIPVMKLSMDGPGTFTIANLFQGTLLQINNVGTLPSLPGGSIAVTTGTIPTLGTMGTLGLVNTITTLLNLTNGSINVTAGTIATLGTMGTLGLVNTITTLSNLTNGSIRVVAGTEIITSGSIAVTAGTVAVTTNGTVASGSIAVIAGTIATLGTMGTLGTVIGLGTVTSLTNGSIVVTAGTMVQTTGTINTGTFSPIPPFAQSTFGTLGTTGAAGFGTLAGGTGAGAGTEIFVTSLSLSIPTTAGSQQVTIGWGSNGGTFHAGTGRLMGGNFPPGGGIQKTFSPPINSGTNGQLMYFQGGAGSVNIDVTYFTQPSTL